MKLYFGTWPDGGPLAGGLWWCWDYAEARGHWVNADGSYADISDFPLHYFARNSRYMELTFIPGMIDDDLRVDRGL